MLTWLKCYLSGRHDYGVCCEPGSVFLRCIHCGRRSAGWALDSHAQHQTPAPVTAAPLTRAASAVTAAATHANIIPFGRRSVTPFPNRAIG